jgi:hypothetical protein
VTIDNTNPAPTLADPGAAAGGTITLGASSDGDTAQVDFQRSPAGANTWTTIGSDVTAPFTASFDTTVVSDGLYDLRAVATDQSGHTGTSGVRTLRVDNTPPFGSLVKPAAGATIGGPSVKLKSTSNDSGSGVASVAYQYRPAGGGAYTTAATVTTAPFDATWDATAVATGDYDFRAVVTDKAGNPFMSLAVTAHVDSTAPTVVLADPGASIDSTTTLTATTSGPDAAHVDFAYSLAGANSWTTIASDTSDPWSVAFDTRTVSDGLYDLRATAFDALGNSSTSVRGNIRIDNTLPSIVSADPVDGSTVAAATSIVLNVSESVTMNGVTLDGAATAPPVVTGNRVAYPTGALADGPHTLAGELEDAAGKRTPFRLHFTVWSGAGADAPYVEKNTQPWATVTLTSSNGLARATMPADPQGGGGDWLVLRVDPSPAPAAVAAGMVPASQVYDVTAWWALAGTDVHSFQQPISIAISGSGSGVVPATEQNGTWRLIPFGSGSSDWFDYENGAVVIHTYHLTQFVLLRDLTPPDAPSRLAGNVESGALKLHWALGSDNSGLISKVLVLADGVVVQTLPPDATSASLAPFDAGDTRRFTIREVDGAGNVSAESRVLKVVPALAGKTVEEARAALEAAGFTLGEVTEQDDATAVPGTILAPGGVVVAADGTAIDVVVATGGGSATKFVFRVSNSTTFSWHNGDVLKARVRATRAARVTASLYRPRSTHLYTWRFHVKAGSSIVKLHMPRQVRRPGVYWLRWVGESGGDKVTKTVTLRILPSGEKLGHIVHPAPRPVEVVLAGHALDTDVALGVDGGRARVVQSTGEGVFDLASRDDTRLLVVADVDEYGLPLVRDLRTVFPTLRILAIAAGADTRTAALRAGADAAVDSSVPDSEIARLIARMVR